MSRPWMPLYVADYLADTTHLSAAEHGAYLLLIMHYWQQGRLPTDGRKLALIARMTAEEWAEARPSIASFFDANWRHARIEAEIAEAEEKYQKRAKAGRKGGESRSKPSNAKAMLKHCLSETPSKTEARLNQPQPHKEREESKKEVEGVGVVSRVDDPLDLYSDAELSMLRIEFDRVDVDSEIEDLIAWTEQIGKEKPNEKKRAIYGALKNRQAKLVGATALEQDIRAGPPEIAISSALANSRMASRRMAR